MARFAPVAGLPVSFNLSVWAKFPRFLHGHVVACAAFLFAHVLTWLIGANFVAKALHSCICFSCSGVRSGVNQQ